MGLIRGFGVWASRSILISALILAIFLSGIVQITNDDYVSSSLEKVIDQQFAGASAQIEDNYNQLVLACNSGEDEVHTSVQEIGVDLYFTCDKVREGKGAVVESMKKQLTDRFLDLRYNQTICEGLGCLTKVLGTTSLQEKISIVMGFNFNELMKTLSTAFLILAILSGVGLVLLSPGISERVIALGYPLTIVGLPYFAKGVFESFLSNLFPSQVFFLIKDFTYLLADKFLIVLIIGVILLVVGLVVKYGFKIK